MFQRRLGIAALVLLASLAALFAWHRHSASLSVATGSPSATSLGTGTSIPMGTVDERVRTGSIAGRVTDEQGKPVAGAAVCTTGNAPKLVSADTNEPHCTQTDADGKYVFNGLPGARYGVNAAAASFKPARYRDAQRDEGFTLKVGEARTGVDIVLEHGGVEVRGVVKDIAGGVVVGATVLIDAGEEWRAQATAAAKTDAQGEFTAWLPAGHIHARAMADGYNAGSKDGVAPGQKIEIFLTPESVLQGRVVEAGTDTPVEGARVDANEIRDTPWGGGEGSSALTDAEGRFRIARLEPGRYQPSATSEHRSGTTAESVLLGLAETSRELVIELRTTPSLIGRIEHEDKKPCDDGSISIKAKGTRDSRWISADADGRVRVEGLEPATYTVGVWCHNALAEDKYDPVTIADKDVTVTWRVKVGFTVRGVVVDSDGNAIDSAGIEAQVRGGDPRAAMGWAGGRTDKDGSFEIKGLRAAKYGLTVQRDGAVSLPDPFEVEVQRNVDGVRIQLPAGGGIDGTVVDESGAAVSGVDIEMKGDRMGMGWGAATSTRDDGTFALPAVRPGTYHVQATKRWTPARKPGTTDDDQQGTMATVKVGETTHVKLVVENQNGKIDGSVVDDSGSTLSDAFVEAERESDSAGASAGEAQRNMRWSWGNVRDPVLTDTDGHFTLTKLAPGSYTVRAFRKGGGETVNEHVKVGSSTTLTIKKEGSIAGTVTTAQGGPPDRFTITLRDAKTGLSRKETFAQTSGVWAVRNLPAGDFVVAAEAKGRIETQIALAQGENKDGIQLTLAPNATVTGTVVSLETNQPVPGMMVFVQPKTAGGLFIMMDDADDRKYVSDANGRFEITDAPSGRVTVNVFPKDWNAVGGYGEALIPATLTPGAATELPPIRVTKRRVTGDLEGDLGFVWQSNPPGTDLADRKLLISVVRPNGPAAAAGLIAGDEVINAEGYDVTAPNTYLASQLLTVSPGTTVKIGVRRGATVSVTAGPPTTM